MQRLPPPPRKRGSLTRIAAATGVLLLLVFWFAALPLPGPLARAREAWWQHSAERRAHVDYQEAHGWPEDADRGPVHGTLRLQDSTATPLTFTATACQSGQRRLFYGVTLTDAQQPTLTVRVVLPETGTPHLTLTQPGHDDLVFNQPTCSAWDVAVEPGNSTYNTIRTLNGHASLTCTTPTTSLTANLAFRNCH